MFRGGRLLGFLLGLILSAAHCQLTLGEIQQTRMAKEQNQGDFQNQLDDFASQSIGHNLSPSGKTLRQRQVSIGTFYVGVGLTDHWTLGFSPFVWSTYKMQHFGTRYSMDWKAGHRFIVSGDYFKTFGPESSSDRFWREACANHWYERDCARGRYPWGFTSFKMEAWSIKLTDSLQVSPLYRLNLTASYYYYIDDEKPFSLRMDPQNKDPYALAFSSLHELRLLKNVYWNLESGIWGANYTYPYLHLGSTINLQLPKTLIGAGASTTWSPTFPSEKARRFAGYQSQQSIHPEIQVQLFY